MTPAGNQAPIGVFDSGVGGLTVLRALRDRLPGERFVYLGDTARVPYGRKPPEMVRGFARQIAGFLVATGVKAVVVACNTAASVALEDLERELPVPVWGVIDPGVGAALAAWRGGVLGVVGTRGTIATGTYQSRIATAGAPVWARACPMFVPLVEEGLFDGEEARLIARHYLQGRPQLDALILGCTHYPLLAPILAAELGPEVAIVDSARAVAVLVATSLADQGLQATGGGPGPVTHYVTGDLAAYRHTAGLIGGVDGELNHLDVDRLLDLEPARA